jgi:uncharacterized delta-60 repeat protein
MLAARIRQLAALTLRGWLVASLVAGAALFAPPPSTVQAASADDGFNPGADGLVRVFAVQADGKILVGGDFSVLGGQPRSRLARLNPDGSLDLTFNPGADDIVHALVVQADGKILVGGEFHTLGSQWRQHIGRLNPDGSLDTAFNPGANYAVYELALQADDKIVVAGAFTELGGRARGSIGRLNPDGSLDPDFDPDIDLWVFTLAVQADGKILVGGIFYTIGGQTRIRLGRINPDGSLDTAFNPYPTGNVHHQELQVSELAVQADGKILVRGVFTVLSGQPCSFLGRLNPDGSLDTAFNPGAGGSIGALTVQADGKILLGGYFTTLGGQPRSHLARLNPDGSLDLTFNPGADDIVYALVVQADGKILVGGNFSVLGGQPRSRLGRLSPDASLDTDFNPGADGSVYVLAVQADDKILVGGYFHTLGGQPRNHLARLNPDGSLDTTFSLGTDGGVQVLAVQADGKILVGGGFTTLGGQPRNNLGRLNPDGSLDTDFNPGHQYDSHHKEVNALAVQANGKILLGGYFLTLGGLPRNGMARLNPDGSLDAAFDPGDQNSSTTHVWVISVQPDGKILVGGQFSRLGGRTCNNVGRLEPDGTLDSSFQLGTNARVFGLAVQADGKILIGGEFTTLGGQPRNNLGRLNPDGSLDLTFNPVPNGYSHPLIVQADGKILTGRGRLNPDGSLDLTFNLGTNSSVYALAVQADGKILLGGSFTNLDVQPRQNIGRLSSDTAALQALSATHSTVTWQRSGAGPELTAVTFEQSGDGLAYTPLGAAARIAGGWQLDGLSLPRDQNLFLRARGNTGTGSVVETVRLVWLANAAAAAAGDAYETPEDVPLVVGSPGVLANDADPDGDPFTAQLLAGPASGALVLAPDGGFSYSPTLNVSGVVTFTYQASDGLALSSPAAVALTLTPVNDLPALAGVPDVLLTRAASPPLSFTVTLSDVETPVAGLELVVLSSNPLLVPADAVSLSGSGAEREVWVAPAGGQTGVATLTLTVRDADGGEANASLLLQVFSRQYYLPFAQGGA